MGDTDNSPELLDDNTERRRLLEVISKNGLYALTKSELERLHRLILLKEINIAIYESSDEAQHA
jgi:hypothetical protein